MALRSPSIVVLLIDLGVSPIRCGRLFPDPRPWALADSKCLFWGDCGVGRVRVAVICVFSVVYVSVVGSALHIDRRSSHRLGCVSDMLWPLVPGPRTWVLADSKCLWVTVV